MGCVLNIIIMLCLVNNSKAILIKRTSFDSAFHR